MITTAANVSRTVARLRNKIERTDDALMALLVRRVGLARQIGRAKERAGLPVLDTAREARVVRWAAARARDLGIPQESVRALFWGIIAMCRSEQVRHLSSASGKSSRKSES